jgi:pimeloyl-ACP methyl ester carboxylesterase
MTNIVALGGFLDAAPLLPSIARDLAPLNPLVLPAPRRFNNWKAGDGEELTVPPAPFIAVGFSDGAPIALELATRSLCRGLVYISGLEADLPYGGGPFRTGWEGFPALCIATTGEIDDLVSGVIETCRKLSAAGANAIFSPASRPRSHWLPKCLDRPHLHGVTHHLPTITNWLQEIR